MTSLQQRATGGLDQDVEPEIIRQHQEIERQMRLAALAASRSELYRMARQGKLSDEMARNMVKGIDLQEARLRV